MVFLSQKCGVNSQILNRNKKNPQSFRLRINLKFIVEYKIQKIWNTFYSFVEIIQSVVFIWRVNRIRI